MKTSSTRTPGRPSGRLKHEDWITVFVNGHEATVGLDTVLGALFDLEHLEGQYPSVKQRVQIAACREAIAATRKALRKIESACIAAGISSAPTPSPAAGTIDFATAAARVRARRRAAKKEGP